MANPQMNKAALVDEIVSKVDGITKRQAGDVLDALTETVSGNVAGGTDVTLPGLGKFTHSERAARTGRNPQTGAAIQIAAAKVPSFKAAKPFKDAVNR